MTRDEARAHWAKSGLTYDALTKESVERLRKMLDKSLKASGLIGGSFRMRVTRNTLRQGNGRKVAELRCKARYFEDREAITFDPHYFIGFAGWADDTNVQPILATFCEWVDEMKPAALAA
jgi:hypothetical protein